MKKLFNILITLLLIMTTQAKTYSAAIDKTIAQSNINKGAISVSVNRSRYSARAHMSCRSNR